MQRPEAEPGRQTEPRGGRQLCRQPEEQEEGEDPTDVRAGLWRLMTD